MLRKKEKLDRVRGLYKEFILLYSSKSSSQVLTEENGLT